MRGLIYSSSVLIASPALAASGPFVSLRNTDFIVLLAFIAFIGVLVYFKVPSLIGGMLDKRANTIRNELDEARKLREEAQKLQDPSYLSIEFANQYSEFFESKTTL